MSTNITEARRHAALLLIDARAMLKQSKTLLEVANAPSLGDMPLIDLIAEAIARTTQASNYLKVSS